MEKARLKPYENEPPASGGKKFFAWLLDAALVCFLTLGLIVAGIAILDNNIGYQGQEAKVTLEMKNCYRIEEEAKIYEFTSNENGLYEHPREQEDIFKDWCLHHILLSYQKDPSVFDDHKTTISNPSNLAPADYTNDSLAFFYVNYVPNHNSYQGKENDIVDYQGSLAKPFYYSVMKGLSPDVSMWVFDETSYDIPYLKSSFAYDLYKYLFSDSSYQAGLTAYNLLATAYQKIWKEEINQLIASSAFQVHYLAYKQAYKACSYGLDLVCLLAFVISYLLIYFLPQLFFKGGRSFGKKLLSLMIVDKDGYQLLNRQMLLRNFLQLFSFFGTTIVSVVLAGGLSSGWMFPLFEISGIGFSPLAFSIVSTVIGLISFIVSCFGAKKQSLSDLISSCYVIDLSYYVDKSRSAEILIQEEEDKKVKEKERENHGEILDSSTIGSLKEDKHHSD
ncbi:MAG: RDD family protein [Bacilli bacterium]|jgi:uncharacterized RDD family membrane protein YckC|nr:RDD family protein [Bacilli bacterium]